MAETPTEAVKKFGKELLSWHNIERYEDRRVARLVRLTTLRELANYHDTTNPVHWGAAYECRLICYRVSSPSSKFRTAALSTILECYLVSNGWFFGYEARLRIY